MFNAKSLHTPMMLIAFAVLCCASSIVLLTHSNAAAESVYHEQAPMTDKELISFIQIFPQFRAWASSSQEQAAPVVVDGKADFKYSDKAAEWVKARGWEPKRFFSVMGKSVAALYVVSEGAEVSSEMPQDMPRVTQEELALVRKHLATLLQAVSDAAPPISQ